MPLTLRELDSIPVVRLRGVGERKREALAAVGVETVLDLLTTYPRRWVDRTNEARVSDLVPGTEALVLVSVRSTSKRMGRNRRTIVETVVGDGTGRMHVVFFNQPWRERQLTPGLEVALYGKVDTYRGGLQMANPVVDLIGDRTGRIVPIYPQSEKVQLTTWELAGWVENALQRAEVRGFADPVPAPVRRRLGLLDRGSALHDIHVPESIADKERARRRLAFDELLRVQVALVMRKRAMERESVGIRHQPGGELVERFHGGLPFPLTAAQRRVIGEIEADLGRPHPMHRLLQGDVGSGKTVVAVTALLAAVQGGHQGALMAPTEVLAEQHAAAVRQMLDGLLVPAGNLFGERPLSVELLTNRVAGAERRRRARRLGGRIGRPRDRHARADPGGRRVPEPRRRGGRRAAPLRRRTAGGAARQGRGCGARRAGDDGDADPAHGGDDGVRRPRRQRARRAPARPDADRDPLGSRTAAGGRGVGVRPGEVAAGRQAYVVCPLVEESEKLEVASAEETYERLSSDELTGLRLGLLHGRMSSADKERTMDSFRSGALDVLVATTVIEVGVDVPNATVMVVLDADRFGIAQLHQLRGRVGRGAAESQCWLVTADGGDGPSPRVAALVASTDGFELAEVDLDLRGEGTLMGAAQKGRSDLRLASLRRDRELVRLARDAAFEIVDADPVLAANPALLDELTLLLTPEDTEFLTRS